MKTRLLKVLTVAMLFLMPNMNFGQAPPLGATESFALFTGGGAFSTEVGDVSIVTGDVGTDAGSFFGFPPGTLIGQKHVADPTADQALIDVGVAYGYLAGLTCDTTIGITLGSGQILPPNVYCVGDGQAAILNGVLTLDGQGDPDALFIFKIDGAFATGNFSEVILMDSASLCNVYWWMSGAFTLGNGSVFRGNVVGGGAIHLLEASTLLGRGLTRAGAINLHNNSVINSCAPSSSIPISTWALVLGGALIAIGVFVSYRRII